MSSKHNFGKGLVFHQANERSKKEEGLCLLCYSCSVAIMILQSAVNGTYKNLVHHESIKKIIKRLLHVSFDVSGSKFIKKLRHLE